MVRLQLAKAPLDDGSLPEDRWYLPLDLLAVASAAEDAGSSVMILDGGTLSIDAIMSRLGTDADVVGLAYSALSIENLGRLASLAHRRGARVVLGGQAATASAENLAKEKFVDLVVRGDGEPAIREIIHQVRKGHWAPEQIPNSVASNGGSIVFGPRVALSGEEIGRFSRTAGNLDPETYVGAFATGNTLKNIQAGRATNVFSKRGCQGTCSFCARTDKRIRARPAHEVAREIAELCRCFELDYVIDTSDTWATGRSWIEAFVGARAASDSPSPELMVFLDARHVDGSLLPLLRQAGIGNVFLGIESACERVLLRNGKPNTKKKIMEAIKGLAVAGIRVSVSFVLGLLGEDDESICETRRFVDAIGGLPGVRAYCNVIMPLPGSPAWREFLQTSSGRRWARAIDYNLQGVREDFVGTMTDVKGGVSRLCQERDAILAQNNLPSLEYAR